MASKATTRALLVLGVVGSLASAVVAGVGTYKAYPELKAGIDAKKKPLDIAKSVAKHYIPALGIAVGTGALLIFGEVLGERKATELEGYLKRAKAKYNTVSNWYKNQSDVLKEHTDEGRIPLQEYNDIQEEAANRDADAICENSSYSKDPNKKCKYVDTFGKIEFEATEFDICKALNRVNKELSLWGFAMYADFYDELGVNIPEKYANYGWSVYSANAMWVDPWVCIDTCKYDDGTVEFWFESDIGGNERTRLAFDPVENPDSEDWM